MMRGPTQPLCLILLIMGSVAGGLGFPALLCAQTPNVGSLASPSGMGPLSMSPGQLMGIGNPNKSADVALSITDSYVNMIDGAAPRSMFMTHLDLGYHMPQPMRAEYFIAKGGLPNSPGLPLLETRINSYQEWYSTGEFALTPWFSMFITAPYRWINPDVNANESGTGDMQYGLKLCTWSSDSVIATLLLRLYQPSARATIGTDHWSIEPGLLAAYRLNPSILFEGELRYWIPIHGSDFAGDILRYGVGVSYGQRQPGGFWYMPVLEGVGWTVMNGKTLSVTTPDQYLIQDARGQTIVNGYLGMRWGYGNVEFYTGYGRSFTGHYWQKDIIRLELRYVF